MSTMKNMVRISENVIIPHVIRFNGCSNCSSNNIFRGMSLKIEVIHENTWIHGNTWNNRDQTTMKSLGCIRLNILLEKQLLNYIKPYNMCKNRIFWNVFHIFHCSCGLRCFKYYQSVIILIFLEKLFLNIF